jgi:AcrR family transcriptional regulator
MAARGRPRGFDRQTALRRAMEAFWRRGYEGTAISDLTKAMGINAPSLYAAFGCKEALFREAVALYNATEGAVSDRALEAAPTARRAVEAMLRLNAAAYVNPRRPPGCMITLAATIGTPECAEVRDFLGRCRQEAQDALEARLARGAAEGDLPAGADIASVAAFYYTVLQGLSIQARDGASRETLDAIVDCAMAAWDGLTTPRRRPKRKSPKGVGARRATVSRRTACAARGKNAVVAGRCRR